MFCSNFDPLCKKKKKKSKLKWIFLFSLSCLWNYFARTLQYLQILVGMETVKVAFYQWEGGSSSTTALVDFRYFRDSWRQLPLRLHCGYLHSTPFPPLSLFCSLVVSRFIIFCPPPSLPFSPRACLGSVYWLNTPAWPPWVWALHFQQRKSEKIHTADCEQTGLNYLKNLDSTRV